MQIGEVWQNLATCGDIIEFALHMPQYLGSENTDFGILNNQIHNPNLILLSGLRSLLWQQWLCPVLMLFLLIWIQSSDTADAFMGQYKWKPTACHVTVK